MSFSFSFFSTSRQAAMDKLRQAYAPLSLKAMIEHSIDLLQWPWPRPVNTASAYDDAKALTSDGARAHPGQGSANMVPPGPTLRGVFVEASGHFDDIGTGASWINILKVNPLYE